MRFGLPQFALRRNPQGKFGKPLGKKYSGRVFALASSLFEKCADLVGLQGLETDRSALCSPVDAFYNGRADLAMIQTGASPRDNNGRTVEIDQGPNPSAWRSIFAVARHTPIQQSGAFENSEACLLRTDFKCQESESIRATFRRSLVFVLYLRLSFSHLIFCEIARDGLPVPRSISARSKSARLLSMVFMTVPCMGANMIDTGIWKIT